MSNPYFLDDSLKVEVAKMQQTTAFKEMLSVAKYRTPDYAESSDSVNQIAAQAKLRQGYEMALATLSAMIFEAPPKENDNVDAILLDPRD